MARGIAGFITTTGRRSVSPVASNPPRVVESVGKETAGKVVVA